jgi:peptidoglycan/LPS O-acetylase OafA/YrhL
MRNVGLDLLRIIAVFLVIGRHLHAAEGESSWIATWQRGGWVGVDLFFVLSGFLIASLLFREQVRTGSVRIKSFLIRRAFKIYPAFWVFLLLTTLARLSFGKPIDVQRAIAEFLFVQNYFVGLWGHTWSLAVEEHFYIGLAILAGWLLSRKRDEPFRSMPTVFCCLAIGCLLLRLVAAVVHPTFIGVLHKFATHARIDSLMFGVLIAYLWQYRGLESRIQWIPSWLLAAVGVALLSPAFVFTLEKTSWIWVVGYTVFYAGSGCLLLAAIRWEQSSSKLVRCFAGLGAASYSIYLWHLPVMTMGYYYVKRIAGGESEWLYLLNAFIGSCAVGWVMNRIVEAPVLKIRDRWFPSAARAVGS